MWKAATSEFGSASIQKCKLSTRFVQGVWHATRHTLLLGIQCICASVKPQEQEKWLTGPCREKVAYCILYFFLMLYFLSPLMVVESMCSPSQMAAFFAVPESKIGTTTDLWGDSRTLAGKGRKVMGMNWIYCQPNTYRRHKNSYGEETWPRVS